MRLKDIPKHILVVDHDGNFNRVLCEQFTAAGFTADGAESLAQAYMLLAKSLAPDLVILDLELIDGSGAEIMGVLTQPRFAHTKTVIVSRAAYSPQHRLDRYHIDQTLLKPIPPRKLVALAWHLLDIQHQLAQAGNTAPTG
jgi:DNA-binding response OmpR family regulator